MKLLKNLIKLVESTDEHEISASSEQKASLSTNQPVKEENSSEAHLALSMSLPVLLSRPTTEGYSLVRHFAISQDVNQIIYIGFDEKKSTKSLASSLFGAKELHYSSVKNITEKLDPASKAMIVISSVSTRWLESVMYLRRALDKVEVLITGTQRDLLVEEKILSKYRENFSGAIMKRNKSFERKYSETLLKKKLNGVPLVFLSDGVIQVKDRSQREKWAA